MCHMGMVKWSQRAREVMFWPGMNKAIEHTIENCDVYHEYCDSNPKEPMLPGPIPERPWEVIATDLFQWSSGDYLLVVNYYSRFIEVELLENTTSSTVVHHTKLILARHGIPTVIISDNGPQFTAKEYQKFTRVGNRAYHIKSTLLLLSTVKWQLKKKCTDYKENVE